MRFCTRCKRKFIPSSRHKLCPRCRKTLDKRPCPSCGNLMQRKSKICILCYSESKQYPYSNKKHISKDGYVYLYYKNHPCADADGRVLEHRLVMEKVLGRCLYPFESVHHLNGVRSDNRLKNLELWAKPQPSGARVKDLVKWAKNILKLYGGISSIG